MNSQTRRWAASSAEDIAEAMRAFEFRSVYGEELPEYTKGTDILHPHCISALSDVVNSACARGPTSVEELGELVDNLGLDRNDLKIFSWKKYCKKFDVLRSNSIPFNPPGALHEMRIDIRNLVVRGYLVNAREQLGCSSYETRPDDDDRPLQQWMYRAPIDEMRVEYQHLLPTFNQCKFKELCFRLTEPLRTSFFFYGSGQIQLKGADSLLVAYLSIEIAMHMLANLKWSVKARLNQLTLENVVSNCQMDGPINCDALLLAEPERCNIIETGSKMVFNLFPAPEATADGARPSPTVIGVGASDYEVTKRGYMFLYEVCTRANVMFPELLAKKQKADEEKARKAAERKQRTDGEEEGENDADRLSRAATALPTSTTKTRSKQTKKRSVKRPASAGASTERIVGPNNNKKKKKKRPADTTTSNNGNKANNKIKSLAVFDALLKELSLNADALYR